MYEYIHSGDKIMIITFCRHSSYEPKPNDEERILKIFNDISNGKQLSFYLGGYGKFDAFAKKCAKKYQNNHPTSKVIFITPYLDNWLNQRKDYLENEYDEIIYPDIENIPPKFAILKRNEWMVKQADYVICYVKTHSGGAYRTLLFAHKHNKPYTNLYNGIYELY